MQMDLLFPWMEAAAILLMNVAAPWAGNHFCFLYHVISIKSLQMLVYWCPMTAVLFVMNFLLWNYFRCTESLHGCQELALALFCLVIYLLIFEVLGNQTQVFVIDLVLQPEAYLQRVLPLSLMHLTAVAYLSELKTDWHSAFSYTQFHTSCRSHDCPSSVLGPNPGSHRALPSFTA